jgi:photosystem II stability/assembly factor-like uncharacterized protein
MYSRNPHRSRSKIAACLALGCLAITAFAGFADEPKPNDPKIADIEKQIQELTKKLDELKKLQAGQAAESTGALPQDWTKAFHWRCIGPAAMGGRITAISVYEADPCIYWIATASGGLLKTTNNGTTFEHQFDHEATVSVGDVCVAPSDSNIVWVGTGENNPRNSVSYGDGVYKSTDGGKTWKNMGLQKTFQIGRVVIHPKNPDIVYVGALGRLYGPNPDRGLFKTTDGGKTWEKVLFVDDKTGVIDIAMRPSEPETLLVATWERQRDGYDSHRGEPPSAEGYDGYDPIKKWGPGSGIYKTTDGGKSFKKLSQGLPTSSLGRVGFSWYRTDPKVVYLILDCEKIGMGTPPSRTFLGIQGEDDKGGAKITQITAASPAAKAELKVGDVIKAVDKQAIPTFLQLTEEIRKHKPDDKLVFAVSRGNEMLDITVALGTRPLDEEQRQNPQSAGRLLGAFGSDAEGGGVQVQRVLPESSAAKAGVVEGDIIQELDKKAVGGIRDLFLQLRERKEGDKFTLKVLREGESKELTVTLVGSSSGPQGSSRTRPWGFAYGGQRENVQDQQGPNSHEYGGVYRSSDAGDSWTRINSLNPRPMYFSVLRVDPSDEKYIYVGGISLSRSSDGGKTFKADGGNGVHPDQHALWIDPRDGRHMIVGCDGGFYATYDRMSHWEHLNHMAIGQFYHVAVDNRRPYRVYGGLQDNGSWGGPSHCLAGSGPINEDWISVAGGDGFVCRVDPFDPDVVYFESQDGNMGRRNLRTGERGFIRPRQAPGSTPYRFNWNTPFILSNHNPHLFYCGGNYVFRSVKQGDDCRIFSPEITRTKRGSATAIAESPRNPDILWAGTDDGYLWVTRDGGKQWTNVSEKVGLPGPRWVSSIEPSRFADGRAYVAFDAHRSDDDEPYIYVTEDYGQTWKSLRSNLPIGSTRVCREDIKNPNLLFAGTEFGAWVSVNRGVGWTKLNNNLPTVAVHEFAIHPAAGEVVIATHGRSLWVLDITPLRQMTKEVLAASAHLYEPNTVVRWRSEPSRGSMYGNGSRLYAGENPPTGAQIYFSLTKKAEKASIKIVDIAGKTVRELEAKTEPGFHRVTWDFARVGGRRGGGPGGAMAFGGQGGGGRRGGGGGGGGGGGAQAAPAAPASVAGAPVAPAAPAQAAEGELPQFPQGMEFGGFGGFGQGRGAGIQAGVYRVILTVDGKEYAQNVRIDLDPSMPANWVAPDEEDEEEANKMFEPEEENEKAIKRKIDHD